MILVDVAGWLAAGALLLAYALLTTSRTTPSSFGYLALNLAGAAGLALNAAAHTAWPSAALNLLWLGFGLHAAHRAKRAQGVREQGDREMVCGQRGDPDVSAPR